MSSSSCVSVAQNLPTPRIVAFLEEHEPLPPRIVSVVNYHYYSLTLVQLLPISLFTLAALLAIRNKAAAERERKAKESEDPEAIEASKHPETEKLSGTPKGESDPIKETANQPATMWEEVHPIRNQV